jgi:3-dehydroquinate dehydratase-2
LHESDNNYDGVILNAGAYTHTSVSIRDAIAAITVPVVLVHISNVYAREIFRNKNLIAPVCKGVITGFGLKSYKIAILSFLD